MTGNHFENVEFEVVREVENACNWPEPFTVPAGYWYRESWNEEKYAQYDTVIGLQCAGDWLEIVKNGEKKGIRYELY